MSESNKNSISYQECFVAFIDVLGFKKIIKDSITNKSILPTLTKALNSMSELSSGIKISRCFDANNNEVIKRWKIQVSSFSDSVVLFIPVETGSISQLLSKIRYLHDRMLNFNLCIRGAVTIGDMYWNEAWSNPPQNNDTQKEDVLYERGLEQNASITLGPGLIDAFTLESEHAIYPRVLIGRRLYDYVKITAPTCFPLGKAVPQKSLLDFFRLADDGWYYLDFLHPSIDRNDTERIIQKKTDNEEPIFEWQRDDKTQDTVIEKINYLIDSWLNNKSCDEKIRSKYEWLRSYVNKVSLY